MSCFYKKNVFQPQQKGKPFGDNLWRWGPQKMKNILQIYMAPKTKRLEMMGCFVLFRNSSPAKGGNSSPGKFLPPFGRQKKNMSVPACIFGFQSAGDKKKSF